MLYNIYFFEQRNKISVTFTPSKKTFTIIIYNEKHEKVIFKHERGNRNT